MPENGVAKRGSAAGGAARRRLAERRKALGLTQEALANLMGVERTTVARWERGESAPLPSMRPKLARGLRISADRLEELLAPGAPLARIRMTAAPPEKVPQTRTARACRASSRRQWRDSPAASPSWRR